MSDYDPDEHEFQEGWEWEPGPAWVLVCHGDALGGHLELAGLYLRSHDPEAHDGRGAAEWTHDVRRALRFETLTDAMLAWQRQSTTVPLRPDGKPNRPLTAFTVEPRKMP